MSTLGIPIKNALLNACLDIQISEPNHTLNRVRRDAALTISRLFLEA
jgi:hypothetical protein